MTEVDVTKGRRVPQSVRVRVDSRTREHRGRKLSKRFY